MKDEVVVVVGRRGTKWDGGSKMEVLLLEVTGERNTKLRLLKEIIIRMTPRETGDNLVMDIVKEHGKLRLGK